MISLIFIIPISWIVFCELHIMDSEGSLSDTVNFLTDSSSHSKVSSYLGMKYMLNTTTSTPSLIRHTYKDINDQMSSLKGDASHRIYNNNKSSNNEKGMAVCLMYMDDGPYLVEWLAYHYHYLPLHRLIVAIDPKSTTSPQPILDRYQNRGLMNITVWHDRDFLFYMNRPTVRPLYRAKLRNEARGNPVFAEYLTRQLVFYSACMRKLHTERYTWIAIVDTDEYVVMNWSSDDIYRIRDVKPTVIEMLDSPINRNVSDTLASPCIPMHRLTVGVKEEPNQTLSRIGLPDEEMCKKEDRSGSVWDATDFLTYRWRYPSDKRNDKLPGKCIVDVSRVNASHSSHRNALSPWYMSPHRPIHDICPPEVVFPKNHMSPFVVHHYVGTYEQWTYRNDSRSKRNKLETYQKLAFDKFGADDSAKFWLQPFVQQQGCRLAQTLLSGVGRLKSP